jgi:hypothetical protein
VRFLSAREREDIISRVRVKKDCSSKNQGVCFTSSRIYNVLEEKDKTTRTNQGLIFLWQNLFTIFFIEFIYPILIYLFFGKNINFFKAYPLLIFLIIDPLSYAVKIY